MSRLPVMLIVMILSVANAFAQGMTPFPIVERCITAPTEPPDDWTFDGTIITFRQGDGVHGFRADTPSRYYIAFDNEKSFAGSGAVSPDGKWFAYFVGSTSDNYYLRNTYTQDFRATHLQVVSVSPARETYTTTFEKFYNGGANVFEIRWLSPIELILYSNTNYYDEDEGTWYSVNPFLDTKELATDEEIDANLSDNRYRFGVQPSTLRVFLTDTETLQTNTLHITDSYAKQVYNTCIETDQAFAVSPTGEQVAVSIGGDDGFVYIVDIATWKAYRLDLAANAIIAWVGDE